MITKGKIISKILNTNKYSVYIPYFSDAGKKEQYVEATLMQDPAINESFLQGDIVFIGFEDGLAAKPVILGKLYLADDSESRGYANLEQLNIKYKAELPEDTTIGNTNFNDVLSSILEKQDKLIAGENITIRDNVISATGGGGSGSYVRYDTDSQGLTNTEKSNARTNIGAGTSNFSGNYNDLSNKPSIPSVNDGILTIQKNGTTVSTFTANASSNITANIIVPTKTSDLANDSGYITNTDIPQEIFWCIYGRTDYSEISTALNEGKLPCVNRNNRIYVYTSSSSSPDKEHHFWSVEGSNIYSLHVRSMNSWSEGYSSLESRLNKVVSISSSSTDTQYPSAKCVYDNIENVREVAEGKKQTYVVSDITNPSFNSQDDIIYVESFTDIESNIIIPRDINIGDTVYVTELDVPDR